MTDMMRMLGMRKRERKKKIKESRPAEVVVESPVARGIARKERGSIAATVATRLPLTEKELLSYADDALSLTCAINDRMQK